MKSLLPVLALFASLALVLSAATGSALAQVVQSGNFIIDASTCERAPSMPVNPATDMELLTNNGFESGNFTPWYHDGAWTISDRNPHTGSYCAFDVGNHWVRQDFAPIPASQIVSATLWMRQPDAEISAIDFFYTNMGYSEDLIWVTTNWAQYDVTSFIEPGGIVNGIRIWGFMGGGAEPDETYLDDISIQTFGAQNVTITLTPDLSTIFLPPEGGVLEYDIAIANAGTSPAFFQVWTGGFQFTPDSLFFGPLLLRNVSLGAGGTIMRTMNQSIPAIAPDGGYNYVGSVGEYPLQIVSSDTFYFSKGVYGADSGGSADSWDVTGWDNSETAALLPLDVRLESLNPNPFNNSVSLDYYAGAEGDIALKVYDVTGRLAAEIVSGYHPAGQYQAKWNAAGMSSGVYLFQLESAAGVSVKKGILLK